MQIQHLRLFISTNFDFIIQTKFRRNFFHFLLQTNTNNSANNNGCNGNSTTQSITKPNGEISVEKIKEHILQITRVVMNAKESAQICHSILSKKEPIAVDAEGINLGTKGQMTLFQISTMDKQSYIFDLLVDANIWIEGIAFSLA